jgi:hypothetical protein
MVLGYSFFTGKPLAQEAHSFHAVRLFIFQLLDALGNLIL